MLSRSFVLGQVVLVCVLALSNVLAEETTGPTIWRRETLTDGFCGLADPLAMQGIDIVMSATSIYQQNVRGGLSTHRRAGRNAGSYHFDTNFDAERLLGIEGGRIHMLIEGKWSQSVGINDTMAGSYFGVNGDAMPRRAIDVTELWYEQTFTDAWQMRIGKMDLTGGFEHHNCPVSFDCSNYAGDEHRQFLNGALINNPTIPFPQYGLGAVLHYGPDNFWYVSAAAADAQADIRETGFRTTFCGPDYFFYIAEAGLTPLLGSEKGALPGAYRFGVWYDPQSKANSDYQEAGRFSRDDAGYYLTFDQMLAKENDRPEDDQGLGAFFRYGHSDSERNDVTDFWSIGVQYKGLFEGRAEDILGAGLAHGTFSDKSAATYTDDYEAAYEVYYSMSLAPWLYVSPDFQYIVNPGGDAGIDDAVVIGLRITMVL